MNKKLQTYLYNHCLLGNLFNRLKESDSTAEQVPLINYKANVGIQLRK